MDFFSVRWDSLLTPLFKSPVIRLSEGDGYRAVCEDLREFRRNGRAALAGKSVVWLHGASIGEVKCLLPIAKNLLADGDCEGAFFTYTSPDGLAEINRSLSKHRTSVVTCPLLKAGIQDLEMCLHGVRLRLCIIAEKDIWPRITTIASAHGTPILGIDARFDCTGNVLSRCAKRFLHTMAARHYDAVCVATTEDYEIARSFVSEERLFLTGPSKALVSFEKSERAKEIRNEYVQRLGIVGKKPVIVAGSLVAREASWIADICVRLLNEHANSFVIVAPRHTRKPKVLHVFKQAFSKKRTGYRLFSSIGEGREEQYGGDNSRVLLVDKMGNLSDIYSVADVAVVGGNFLGSCGHNLFEPVAMGVPVICGRNTKAGEGVYTQLVQAEGVVQASPQNLLERVRDILLDSHGAHEQCLRACEVLRRLAKSAERNLRIAENLVQGREPEA